MSKNDIHPIYKPKDTPMSVAVLLSGSGTNFLEIYQEQKLLEDKGRPKYGRVDVVFTNVPNCIGAQIAEEYGIPVVELSSKKYFELIEKDPDDDEARSHYDAAVIQLIEQVCTPDLIVLAGYRRRLSSVFLERYNNKVINLYPGDTTKDYLVRGVDASIQALRAGEREIKCTVYLQRADQRFGPALIQSKPISLEGFTENDRNQMSEKIREEGEWKIFPYAVHNLIAKGCLGIDSEDNIYMDGVKLEAAGLQHGG